MFKFNKNILSKLFIKNFCPSFKNELRIILIIELFFIKKSYI